MNIRKIGFVGLAALPLIATASNAEEDPGLQQLAAEVYAKKHDVGLAEARRRLLIQDRAAGIEDRLEILLGANDAGMWYDHDDEGRLKIGITRNAAARTADVERLIGEYRLGGDARVVNVQYSIAELERLQSSVYESLRDLARAGHVSTGYNVKLNRVVVRAIETLPADEEARLAEVARAPGVSVQRMNAKDLLLDPRACQISACNPPLRGGRSMYVCTAGFMARHRIFTSHLLVLTAGHCITSGVFAARDETLLQWSTIGNGYGGILGGSLGIDAGVIYIDPSQSWYSPLPAAKVVVKASSQTAYNPDYKISYDAKSTLGQTLCYSGGYTGSGCAEVTDLGQTHTMSDGVVLKNLGELDTCHFVKGDSGAPVFKGNKGYGIVVGVVDTWPHCFGVYQGIRAAENALNVDILQMW